MNETARSTPSPPHRGPLRRRTRSSGSSTSSFSSSSSSSPSPLPHLSSIPFSWEHLPGVPKIPRIPSSLPSPLLPLPPLLKPSIVPPPRRKKPDPPIPIIDPFAAALAECAKDSPIPSSDPSNLDAFWRRGAVLSRRRPLSTRFGLPDLYSSCKTACSVSDSTILIPRSGSLSRRSA